MTISRFFKILVSWKLTCDCIQLLDYISGHSLYAQDWFRRFIRFTPALLNNIRNSSLPMEEKKAAFSRAVSWFRFGNIFKLTSSDRTLLADEAVISLALEMKSPILMEVGSSDGASSLKLFETKSVFSKVVLTDRFNVFFQEKSVVGTVFYDADMKPLYFKLGCLSFDLRSLKSVTGERPERIETSNPKLERGYKIDRIERYDMFNDVSDGGYDIIKCCNLLNSSYFSDELIGYAVGNIAKSIVNGGYLVVSQNNDKYVGGEAMFILQKKQDGLKLIESVNDHDIVHLFSK